MSFMLKTLSRRDTGAAAVGPLLAIDKVRSFTDVAGSNPVNEVLAISKLAALAAPTSCDLGSAEARRERSAIISADGVPLWEADAMAGLQSWTEPEIASFKARQTRISWLGYAKHADRLAELLMYRDRDADDRALCIECSRASGGWRCSARQAFLLDQLQRCPSFTAVADQPISIDRAGGMQ